MARDVRYEGLSQVGPTPKIWKKFIAERLLSHPEEGHIVRLPVENFGGVVASTVGDYGAWKSAEDTTAGISQAMVDDRPVVSFSTSATDNKEVWLASNNNQAALGKIDPDDATIKVLALEARLRVRQIVTQDLFCGLTATGVAALDFMSDADAMADKSVLGFRVLTADADGLDFVWKKEGQTEVVLIDVLQQLVADVWYKVGFLYDIGAPNGKKLKIFLDGQEQSTYGTYAQLTAATWPDVALQLMAGIKNAAAADSVLQFSMLQAGVLYQ